MIKPAEITLNAPVVCSQNAPLGVVAHMAGAEHIKLKKDKAGVYHYIPLAWVTKVDAEVHLDRTASQAMSEWSLMPPKTNGVAHTPKTRTPKK